MNHLTLLKQLKTCTAWLLVLLGIMIANICFAGDIVEIGVLAKRGTQRCIDQWSPTTEYLSNIIVEKEFKIIPIAFNEINRKVADSEVNFILANSSIYVELELKDTIQSLKDAVVSIKTLSALLPICSNCKK